MLLQRVITAAILAPLLIWWIAFGPKFEFLALLVVILAAWEFSGLFKKPGYKKRLACLVIILLIILLLEFIVYPPFVKFLRFGAHIPLFFFVSENIFLSSLVLGVGWWLITPYFLCRYAKTRYDFFVSSFVLGILIFVPFWFGLVVLYACGRFFLFYLLAIVWANDIGAYFAGKSFGRRLLAPNISPKKTIAGFWGGMFASLIVAIGGTLLLKYNEDYSVVKLDILRSILFLTLSMVACVWSAIGDLFESMLKRQAKVKDSGQLLPGHGGIYDRVDGLIAATPIFALGIFLMIVW